MYFIDSKEDQYDSSGNNRTLTDDSKLITTIKNPRCGLTSKKYRKQVNWHRNKVEEYLYKGYSQQEIIDKLHVSQSTISRDIALIHGSIEKDVRDYGRSILGNHTDVMNGLDELIKRLWMILDNPRTSDKVRIKTIEVVKECYSERRALYDDWIIVLKLKQKSDEINIKENYFRDNNITQDFTKSKSIDKIRIDINEIREKSIRERKDFVF